MTDATTDLNLGSLNGHAVGRILKEAVRRASSTIRTQSASFEAHTKRGYSGDMDDVFTSADRAAQEVYLRTFSECFPACGVIAEEDTLQIDPKSPTTAYFTVDPLDGTKAFVRRQSHGVATMIALVDAGQVISAYVGDINADEVYGYRPGSNKTHRITRLDSFEVLDGAPVKDLTIDNAVGLLRDPPEKHQPETRELIARLRSYEVMGSSIGTWAARLWKREIDAAILPRGFETPWDSTPVIGISQKLGFAFLKSADGAWTEYQPDLPTTATQRDFDCLIIHSSLLEGGKLPI